MTLQMRSDDNVRMVGFTWSSVRLLEIAIDQII